MSETLKIPLPMEERSKIESEEHYQAWKKGPFNFLLQRSQAMYFNKKVTKRRASIEKEINHELPPLTDDLLSHLNQFALQKYSKTCRLRYKNTGFQFTRFERYFLATVEELISENPEFKHLEIYPSNYHNQHLPKRVKALIGVHVPDFLIFGLKTKRFSSIAFEIDGDSHIYKYSKDQQKQKNLEELGVCTLSLPNNKATDKDYIESIFKRLVRKRSGALDKQILNHKRRIWCKTVACHLSLHEIETIASKDFGVRLNLSREAVALRKLKSCPRKVKKEIQGL